MKNITKAGITSLVAVTLVAGLAGPAMAAESSPAPHGAKSPVTLSSLQTRTAAETTKRLAQLNSALVKAQANTHLSSTNKAAMVNTLNSTISTLTSDEAKVAADTALATARADAKQLRKDAAAGEKALRVERATARSENKVARDKKADTRGHKAKHPVSSVTPAPSSTN